MPAREGDTHLSLKRKTIDFRKANADCGRCSRVSRSEVFRQIPRQHSRTSSRSGQRRIAERERCETCLGFELLPIRDNLLGTLTFVGQDGATRVNALEEAAMIKNAQPLTLQGVRALRKDWLGGRDSAPRSRRSEASRAAPEDEPSSQTPEQICEGVWLGVRDGIRNWLVTAA